MKFRVAKKVAARWARGESSYTDNKYGTVIRAHRKLCSYYTRKGIDHSPSGSLQFRGLPYRGIPGLSYGFAQKCNQCEKR